MTAGPAGGADADLVQPFQIEASHLRGRLVRLGPAAAGILTAHAYPEPVARLLGEMLVLGTLLASALKYDGLFTLQAKGDGPVSLVVADLTAEGELRGTASFDAARLPADLPAEGPVPVAALLGRGWLAFTVDQGEGTLPYQGIVELAGPTMVDCLQHYFRQSEQIRAGITLAVGRADQGEAAGWRAGGLMVQRLPRPGEAAVASDREDDWRRAMVLMESCTAAELLDPDLPPTGLLYRLFHEDGVRVFTPVPLRRGCRCSRQRVERILASLPSGEVESYQEPDGRITMVCEFCNTAYRFEHGELSAIRTVAGR